MKVLRANVIDLMEALGFKGVKSWNKEKTQRRVNGIPLMDIDDVKLTEEQLALFNTIKEAGKDVDVVATEEEMGEEVDEEGEPLDDVGEEVEVGDETEEDGEVVEEGEDGGVSNDPSLKSEQKVKSGRKVRTKTKAGKNIKGKPVDVQNVMRRLVKASKALQSCGVTGDIAKKVEDLIESTGFKEEVKTKIPKESPVGVRHTEGRLFFAGQVLKECDLKKGITDDLVGKVDALMKKKGNTQESRWALAQAWHVLDGYLGE